jgi:hypothetical protein
LVDCLVVCRALLEHLRREPAAFYEAHASSSRGLLDAKRTEVGHRVAAMKAKAARELATLQDRMDSRFEEWVEDRELEAEEISPRDYDIDLLGIAYACPVCGFQGRLFGRVEVEAQHQERPPIDDHTPTEVFVAEWTVEFYPEAFECCVCRLILHGRDELAEANLPVGREVIEASQLGYDFDPAQYAENRFW